MSMASAIATLARVSDSRFRACFGTGFTARMAVGQRPMPLDELFHYVAVVRTLLDGGVATVDGRPVRMAHWADMATPRPVEVPIWLSVFGPRGRSRAPELADGIIGFPHPTLPSATLISGTVLGTDETRDSPRVKEAIAPWRVVDWHGAYTSGGAEVVDAMPGGREWRLALEALGPEEERHTLIFEGHVTHLTERDKPLVAHIDTKTMVAEPDSIGRKLRRLGAAGFQEIIYTPTGPDVPRELRALADAFKNSDDDA
jgi:5,10-methylenetetrahydromethanopterin reductase